MPKIFELKQLHTEALDKAEALVNTATAERREMTAVESELSNVHLATAKEYQKQIRAQESQNTLRAHLGPGGVGFFGSKMLPVPSEPAASLPSTGRAHSGLSSPAGRGLQAALALAAPAEVEQVRAFAKYLGGDMEAASDLTPNGAGGFFIPTIVAGVVARNYYAYTPVRNVSTIWATDGGEPTTFPVLSDSDTAVILAPEALTGADFTVSGNAPPTAITGPQLHAYKFSSKPISVPRELKTDSNLNVLEEMLNALLARIARTQNALYTSGTGVGQPAGFLNDATAYSAGSVPLTLDLAMDLAYSVPAMYRPSSIYMASDVTIKYLRKLKTGIAGDLRSLWKDAFEEGNATLGTPAKLHGYPILVNNDMPSVAADGTFTGVTPLAFGDFQRFIIREAERGAPFVYRFDVPAIDSSCVIAFSRSDSKLVVPTAISKLTN